MSVDSRSARPMQMTGDGATIPASGSRIRVGRLLAVAGRTVHLHDRGAGPPVLLLHGLGGLGQEILAPLEPLAVRYRLLAPDRPGYGLSDPLPEPEMAPDRQADRLLLLLDRLGVGPVRIVAHSLGTAVALCLALKRPDRVLDLLLLCPFCRPTRPALAPLLRLAVAPLVGAPLRRHLLPGLADRLAASRLALLCAPDPVPPTFPGFPVRHAVRPAAVLAMAAELRGFNRAMIRAALRLRRCPVPAAILTGAGDEVADGRRHGDWLAGRLPGARLLRLSGCGHMPHHTRTGRVLAEFERPLPSALPRRLPAGHAVRRQGRADGEAGR